MTLELFADMRGQISRAEDEIRGTVNKETRTIYYWRVRPRDFLNAETVHYPGNQNQTSRVPSGTMVNNNSLGIGTIK